MKKFTLAVLIFFVMVGLGHGCSSSPEENMVTTPPGDQAKDDSGDDPGDDENDEGNLPSGTEVVSNDDIKIEHPKCSNSSFTVEITHKNIDPLNMNVDDCNWSDVDAFIDISDSQDFFTFYNYALIGVTGTERSITAPSGANADHSCWGGSSESPSDPTLSFEPNSSYYVRVLDVSRVHSAVLKFTVPRCK